MVSTPRNHIYLQGGMMDAHLRSDMQDVIDALNTDTPLSQEKVMAFSSTHEERDVVENLRRINDSISQGYTGRIQMVGRVKNLTARTNLTNIINAHNSRVGSKSGKGTGKSAKGAGK